MSVKNTRQKGRKLVLKIIEILRRELDDAAYEVVGSGAGKDKGDIRIPRLDLVVEAKNWKQVNMVSWIRQTEKEGLGYSDAVLMWRVPSSPSANPEIRVDMSLDYFIKMAQRFGEPKVKVQDRELKYQLVNLKNLCNRVVKKL